MGLDMYLNRKTVMFPNTKGPLSIVREGGDTQGALEFKVSNYVTLTEQLGHLQKANHIHNWFVQNVQNGKDDCAEYAVEREQLIDLWNTIVTVLGSVEMVEDTEPVDQSNDYIPARPLVIKSTEVAQRLLPTRRGFFFGSTAYDQYYVSSLRATQEILDLALHSPTYDTDAAEVILTYQATW